MPIGYGSKTQIPGLSPNEIAQFAIHKNEEKTSLSWLSWLLTAAEVGLSFIPGVGEVGAVLLGVVNAAAQTGIEVAETGSVSPLSVALNFGGSLIPGAIGGVKYVRKSMKLAEKIQPGVNQLLKDLPKNIAGYDVRVQKFADIVTKTQGHETTRVGKWFNDLYRKGTAEQHEIALNIVKNPLTKNRFYDNVAIDKLKQFQGAKFVNPKDFREVISSIGKQGNLSGYAGKNWRKIEGYAFGGRLGRVGADGGTSASQRAKLESQLSDLTGLFRREIRALQGFINKETGELTNFQGWFRILKGAFERTKNPFLELVISGAKKQKFLKLLTRTETTAAKVSRIASQTMSKTTKYGSMILSPSSLASEIISKTVAKLTPYVEKLGERFAEKITSFVKKGAKGLKELEEEFVKTGGIKVNSEWVMGIKVIAADPVMSTVLFQFNPATSGHKQAVIANISGIKVEEFLNSGSKGRWYINNIARSRGGRKMSAFGIEGELAVFMGILPINKIQEMLGFATWTKSTITQIKSTSGTPIWNPGYWTGLKSGIMEGVMMEGIKGIVALGTRNQYFKQALEGGLGGIAHGGDFKSAFTTGFKGALSSYKDMRFEDHTASGNAVKELKKFQATGGSLKSIF